MAVVSFANAKGGTGKTTIALLLGMDLVRRGYSVAVLDADPQGWISTWFDQSAPNARFQVSRGVTTGTLPGHLRRLHEVADYVLIDLSGASDVLTAFAVGLSDLVLVPVQGCVLDGQGAARTLELIQYVETNARTRINHAVVLNRVNPIVTTRAVRSVAAMLSSRGVGMLTAAIAERSAYRDLFEQGKLLHALDPRTVSNLSRARSNTEAFAQEVLTLLRGGEQPRAAAPFASICYRSETRVTADAKSGIVVH